jgi:hypothetical protein
MAPVAGALIVGVGWSAALLGGNERGRAPARSGLRVPRRAWDDDYGVTLLMRVDQLLSAPRVFPQVGSAR